MIQKVLNTINGRDVSILTTMLDTDIQDMMDSEKLFKATLVAVQDSIIKKIVELVEPRIVEHIMSKLDVAALVDSAAKDAVRRALFPSKTDNNTIHAGER